MSESSFIASPGVSAAGHRLEAFYTQVGGVIEGDPGVRILGVNSLDAAKAEELTFAESEKYLSAVEQSQAAAIIVPAAFPSVAGKTLWRVEKPRLAFIQVVNLLRPPALPPRGIDRRAVVAADAQLGEQVTIRECAVIRSKARIGGGTVIETGVHIIYVISRIVRTDSAEGLSAESDFKIRVISKNRTRPKQPVR